MMVAASVQGSPFQKFTCQSPDHLLSYGVIVNALMVWEASIMLLVGWLIGSYSIPPLGYSWGPKMSYSTGPLWVDPPIKSLLSPAQIDGSVDR